MSNIAGYISEGKKALEGLTFSTEVVLITSTHNSLARTSHMAPSNHKKEGNATLVCPETRGTQKISVIRTNEYPRLVLGFSLFLSLLYFPFHK